MKYLLGVVFLFGSFSLFSSVHLVDNSVNAPGVFNSLQMAIGFAAEGDTIFVKGTFVDYGEGDDNVIQLNKRLVLIGEGPFNTSDGAVNEGEFTLITTLALQKGGNGSSIRGFHLEFINFSNTPGSLSTFTDFSFYNNKIDHLDQESPLDDFGRITFINNLIYPGDGGFDWSRMSGLIMKNNFMHFRKHFRPAAGDNLLSNNMIIVEGPSDRISYGTGSQNEELFERQWQVENVTFQNNVFFMTEDSTPAIDRLAVLGSNVILQNNLAINTTDVRDLLSTGNIANTVSDFLTEEEPFVGANNFRIDRFPFINFEPTSTDFSLKEGSVGESAGLDGADIGLYGGEFPWTDGPNHKYELGSSLPIPVIEILETRKTVVKPGEGLKVRIKARSNN